MADFACADNAAVESCIGTVADGETMTMGTLGNKVFKVTAIDSAGNITTKDVAYMVNSTDVTMQRRQRAPSTRSLALTLPTTPPNFGAFTPGVAREYLDHGRVARHLDRRRRCADGLRPGDDGHRPPRQRRVRRSRTRCRSTRRSGGSTAGRPGGNVGGAAAPTSLAQYARSGHQRQR